MPGQITILDPIQEAPERKNALNARVDELGNKVIAIRHHASWTKYKKFHETVTELLHEHYGIKGTVKEMNVPGRGLAPEKLDAMANQADAAIFGLAA